MAKGRDYYKIAEERMQRPADVKRRPRLLIYSRNKKGKTTFSLSAGVDRTLVLDPEKGTDEMKKKNPHVWPIRAWSDMDDAYEFLRHVNKCPFKGCEFGKDHPFTWTSVDGLTVMSNMSLKYVGHLETEKSLTRIPGLVQQRDYNKSGELMKDMLVKFHNLGQGIVFTAQERQVEAFDSEEDEDYDDIAAAYVPDLPRGVRGSVNSIVDVIGRLYVVKGDDDKPHRRLWIGDSAKYDTGYRSDFGPLPDMVDDPTIGKLVTLMRTGKTSKRKA